MGQCAGSGIEARTTAMLIAAAREPDLSGFQWAILACVAERPGLSVRDIAERLDTSRPTASRVVEGLLEAGLVDRSTPSQDRRLVEVRLTPKGRALLGRIDAAGT